MDKEKDDQDNLGYQDNNNKNHKNEKLDQVVSDDELISKVMSSSGHDDDESTETKQTKGEIKNTKSLSVSEILGILFATGFITFVVLLVYMKYTSNCGMLGSTIESYIGNFICRGDIVKITDTAESSSDDMTLQQELASPDTSAQDVTEVQDSGKPGSESLSTDTVNESYEDLDSIVNETDEVGLTEQQKRDIAATFNQDGTDGGAAVVAPEPRFETPALLISENKQKITNRQPVRIKSIGFRDGQEFKKGDVLVTFDCKQIEFDLEIQKEILKQRQASLDNLKKLKQLKSTSEFSVVKAESELGQTKKLIEKLDDQLEGCIIKADYSGKVITTNATEGEFLFAGKEIMTVNNNEDLLVKAYVPVDWIEWLGVGSTFKLCIGTDCYDGVVNRIGAEVDAISQTLDVFGRIPSEGNDKLISGLSGQITFDKP